MRVTQGIERPYSLEGALLESCSCRSPCPCWIGADPDEGSCRGFNAYSIARGTIGGVDISGCNFIRVFDISGNIRSPGSWRQIFVIDVRATEKQSAAILAAYHGELGGPLADLAQLVKETLGVERAEISYAFTKGSGHVRVGRLINVAVTPYLGAHGEVTTLHGSLMATIPRAPAYVARAERHTVAMEKYEFAWTFEGRSAIHSRYRVTNDV